MCLYCRVGGRSKHSLKSQVTGAGWTMLGGKLVQTMASLGALVSMYTTFMVLTLGASWSRLLLVQLD